MYQIELEVFVHGALCMAYSGRCLLSGYSNHRDANQGTNTNACRWKYGVEEGEENELGEIVHRNSATEKIAPILGEGDLITAKRRLFSNDFNTLSRAQ